MQEQVIWKTFVYTSQKTALIIRKDNRCANAYEALNLDYCHGVQDSRKCSDNMGAVRDPGLGQNWGKPAIHS